MGPRSHTRRARLSRQLRKATPEQLEAVERILAGPAVPERLRPGQPRYALHREGPLWRLRFDEGQAILKHEQGICYVAEMLSHPRERIKKLNLAAKYSSSRSPGGSDIEVYDPATGHISIHRFLRNLVGRSDTVASPLRVRQAFAKHLERYLLVPSSRYAAPGSRKARGDLTGCLLYDPPAETRWTVSQ